MRIAFYVKEIASETHLQREPKPSRFSQFQDLPGGLYRELGRQASFEPTRFKSYPMSKQKRYRQNLIPMKHGTRSTTNRSFGFRLPHLNLKALKYLLIRRVGNTQNNVGRLVGGSIGYGPGQLVFGR